LWLFLGYEEKVKKQMKIKKEEKSVEIPHA
jgi:hypothetical protein